MSLQTTVTAALHRGLSIGLRCFGLSFSRSLGLSLGLIASLLPGSAAAWGPAGHEIVGAIADQLLKGSHAAAQVQKIQLSNLRTGSVWADCARSVALLKGKWTYVVDPKYKAACGVFETPASEALMVDFVRRNASYCGFMAGHTRCRHEAYHFTDISIDQPGYSPQLPGAAPNDLVQAIGAAITVLQGGKSPAPFDIANPREALRLLTHYIGDLHQPLHVGSVYLDDAGKRVTPATEQEAKDHSNAGGNAILLGSSKLHALWDNVPDKLSVSLQAGAGATEARQVQPATGPIAQWPTAWASETVSQSAQVFQGLHIGAKTAAQPGSSAAWPATSDEPAYRLARENLQHAQLVKAGARLAQVLKAIWP